MREFTDEEKLYYQLWDEMCNDPTIQNAHDVTQTRWFKYQVDNGGFNEFNISINRMAEIIIIANAIKHLAHL
jgi:hypothetical protein